MVIPDELVSGLNNDKNGLLKRYVVAQVIEVRDTSSPCGWIALVRFPKNWEHSLVLDKRLADFYTLCVCCCSVQSQKLE